MRIVITGALGHIGSFFSHNLPSIFPGCEIIMIDSLSTQRFPSLFELPTSAKYKFFSGQVQSIEMSSIIKNADFIIHLAAMTDAASSIDKADELERCNFDATRAIASVAADLGIPMIFASSTSVYGSQKEIVDEDCELAELKPQSPYAAVKLKEEFYLKELAGSKNLKIAIMRFGTIFGYSVGMRFHTAVNKFCWQAVMNEPITVWKTAYDQKRPYLGLQDCLNGIEIVLRNQLFNGELFNLVSCNMTVRQIVEIIKDSIPSLQVTFVDHKIMNQLSYEVLNKKLSPYGFQALSKPSEEIKNTIKVLKGCNTL